MKSIQHDSIYEPRREKKIFGFPTRSDTNQSVQPQKMATSLKFQIKQEEELYYPCSENKGADQLCSYCTAGAVTDLRLCFRICEIRFSHDMAHI